MTPDTFTIAHEITFVAFGGFSVLVALRGARSWLGALLFAAALATAVWAQTRVAILYGVAPVWLDPITIGLRDAAWLGFCLGLVHRRGGNTVLWRTLLMVTVTLVILQLVLDLSRFDAGVVAGIHVDGSLIRLAETILGLVLFENIFRNASASEFWSLKHFLIGLVCILVFQLVSRVPEFLTHSADPNMAIVRPLVYVLVLPLFVVSSIRLPNLQLRVHSSRAFVFHTATLIGAGIMLQGVAVAAWYVRQYGGSNGTVLAVMLLFGGAVAIAVLLVSGGVRSRIRKFINENFFSLKYDYRLEWEKVIRALSLNPEQGTAERVLRTLCELLDSPGGALWIYRASWDQFLPAAKLGFTSAFVPIPESDRRIDLFRREEIAFLELPDASDEPAVADLRRDFESAWVVVPLRYRSNLVGIAVLTKTRAPKKLDWEDESFIRLVALQLGGYIVQEETAHALADARQLEEFNKRFAFVVHDIKNTIGQLSLLVRNAPQFGHEQEFRDDMAVTLANAVERLQQLLKSLTVVGTEKVPGNRPREVIELISFIREFTKEKTNLRQAVILTSNCQALELSLMGADNLRRVLEHVVSNAAEASREGEPVEICVTAATESVEIKVTDHGSGMTKKFIDEELFRPLRTTKGGGFGIGAYQARQLMRDLGGDIVVASKVGDGTSVSLSLPLGHQEGIRAV